MIAFPDEPPEDDESMSIDPSLDEIARRAASIRSGWSDAQRKRRRVHQQPKSWLPPIVIVADLSANAASGQYE